MVVNVTSSATLAPMPLVAVYTASKTAVEGFTASLAHELEAFGVRVKLVQPGYGPSTGFTGNAGAHGRAVSAGLCAVCAGRVRAFANPAAVTVAGDVAEVVWRAANDVSGQCRYPAGPDAVALAEAAAAR
jgi:short-subunit dehydrogenase